MTAKQQQFLTSLGRPPARLTAELLAATADRGWLSRMTQALQQYWQQKNHRRTTRPVAGPTPSTLAPAVRQPARV